MKRVFVDTGGCVALLVAEDQMHARAAELFGSASRERWALVTTNAVVIETYSVLLARARDGRRAAISFLDAVEASAGALAVEPVRVDDAPGRASRFFQLTCDLAAPWRHPARELRDRQSRGRLR